MRWPSVVLGAAVPVAERPRARPSDPGAAVFLPEARRAVAPLEDPAGPSDARPVRPNDRVLDRVAAVVPAEVGGAALPARGPRGAPASRVEPRRADVPRSVQLVARPPADGHLPPFACRPGETMDAVLPSRVRQSVRGGIARRREHLPRYGASLPIPPVIRGGGPASCAAVRRSAARRSGRNHPDQRIRRTATATGGTRYAGGPRRSEVPELSRRAPRVSGSAW